MKEKEKKVTKQEILSIVFLMIFVAAVICAGIFLMPKGGWGILGFIGVFLLGIVLLVSWHASRYEYICKECKNKFKINFYKDLFSQQTTNTKYLKCPKCGKRTWAKEIVLDKA